MKVRDVMLSEPRVCDRKDTLAAAGRTMTEVGCGVLPVVDRRRHVVGVITDRDICCFLTARDVRPSEVTVAEAMSEIVYSCVERDEISTALTIMRGYKVRRLPVVDEDGLLRGLLSLDDVALRARAFETHEAATPYASAVAKTLQEIAEHPGLVLAAKR